MFGEQEKKWHTAPDTVRRHQSSPKADARQHRNISVETVDIRDGQQHMLARS